MRAARWSLFVFVVLYFFPVNPTPVNIYKVCGWVLAGLTAALVVGGRAKLALNRRYTVPSLILLVAGFLGSLTFGGVSLVFTAKMAQNLVLLMLLPSLLVGLSDVVLVLRAVGIGGLLTALSGMWQLAHGFSGRLTGILANANGFGQICAQAAIALVALALMARRRLWRIVLRCLAVPCLVGLVLSGSRGAMVAFVAALLALLVMRGTRAAAIVAAAVVGLVVVIALPQQIADRWAATMEWDARNRSAGIGTRAELARRGLVVYRAHPVFGTGFGNARRGMAEVGLYAESVTHNVLTQVMAEAGTVGLVAFCVLIAVTFRVFWEFPVPLDESPVSPGRKSPVGRRAPPHGSLRYLGPRWTPASPPRGTPSAGPHRIHRPARAPVPAGVCSRSAGARSQAALAGRAQAVRVALVSLMLMITVGQQVSGNYVHAIWYILFGVGQSIVSWQARYRALARPARPVGRLGAAPAPAIGPGRGP